MEIVGYADRLRAQPGETIGFKVSCRAPGYSAQLVRLIHTDRRPIGPGFKQELIDSPANAAYPGRVQTVNPGSYITVPHHPALNLENGFTIAAWIYPTAPDKGAQAILTKWRPADSAGYGLVIDEEGCLGFWIGDGRDNQEEISTGVKLRARTWYFTAVSYDPETGETTLRHTPAAGSRETEEAAVGGPAYLQPAVNESPLLIGACLERTIARHFNGKIDSPKVYDRVLSAAEIDDLFVDRFPDRGLAAAWDFGRDFSVAEIADVSGAERHGTAVNLPARAVTGHNWNGAEDDFQRAPGQYAAIHFRDDDLEDAGWENDFEYTVPEDLRSGAYSFRLRAGTDEDHIPFLVRPPAGRPAARIALLFNTYTLLAYGAPQPGDGTAPCYISARRPLPNFRPGRPGKRSGAAGDEERGRWDADLRLADWLEEAGHKFDVITDEDLHEEGAGALAPYRTVLSVSYPECWTGNMLDGLEEYLNDGGRFMYLGGAGLSRVTSVDPHRPHVIEIRGWPDAGPGESFHSATGERGGLWANRGRAPERLVGIGSAVEPGNGTRSAYRRTEDGYHPRAAFIFAGVAGETFGDFAAPGMGRGAAGGQVERMDGDPDGPRRALRVAVAADFHQAGRAEQAGEAGGAEGPVRADMVYTEYPNGGAVFAAGSSAWSACLSYNGYDNDISKITDNVLRRFASDDPLPA